MPFTFQSNYISPLQKRRVLYNEDMKKNMAFITVSYINSKKVTVSLLLDTDLIFSSLFPLHLLLHLNQPWYLELFIWIFDISSVISYKQIIGVQF